MIRAVPGAAHRAAPGRARAERDRLRGARHPAPASPPQLARLVLAHELTEAHAQIGFTRLEALVDDRGFAQQVVDQWRSVVPSGAFRLAPAWPQA
jgi:hypothetical protein